MYSSALAIRSSGRLCGSGTKGRGVVQDVRRIREHPLVAKDIPVYGYIYDVYSGNLVEVAEATEAGRAR